MARAGSVQPDAQFRHQPLVAGELRRRVVLVVGGIHIAVGHRFGFQRAHVGGVRRGLAEGIVQRRDHRRVQRARARDADFRLHGDVVAQFAQRRHGLPALQALRLGHGQQAHLAGFSHGAPAGFDHDVDMAAQQRRQRIGAALERDEVELDAGLLLQPPHGDLAERTGADGSHVDLAGVGARVSDEVAEALPRRACRHGDAIDIAGQADDVGKVLDGVVADRLQVRQAEQRGRDQRQRVAVARRAARHRGGPQRAAHAGLVLDHDRLAQRLRRRQAQRAHLHVGGAAGGEGHDQGDGARGPGLGARGGGQAERGHGGDERRGRHGLQHCAPAGIGGALGAVGAGHGGLLVWSAAARAGCLPDAFSASRVSGLWLIAVLCCLRKSLWWLRECRDAGTRQSDSELESRTRMSAPAWQARHAHPTHGIGIA
ncbi:hypothetical protein CBM2587_A230116 [Cupriavidus taiwanensis]|uniref:Uncharacterized protein n=1 Tax=Cupriavidus taiwanensis TaxID=164546 RepID=A0A975X0M6_9BURK|nr:hypothetical protein CBM2587_A230116 [Cupriavidus taiwanensis]